eukprot:jgi/Mesvir1/29684/Mv00921-RA.1
MKKATIYCKCSACGFRMSTMFRELRGGLPAFVVFYVNKRETVREGCEVASDRFAAQVAVDDGSVVDVDMRLRGFIERSPGGATTFWRRGDEANDVWWGHDGARRTRHKCEQGSAGEPGGEMACVYEVAPAAENHCDAVAGEPSSMGAEQGAVPGVPVDASGSHKRVPVLAEVRGGTVPGGEACPIDLSDGFGDDGAGPAAVRAQEADTPFVRQASLDFLRLREKCEGLVLQRRNDVMFKGPYGSLLELFYVLLCEWQAQRGVQPLRRLTFASRNARASSCVGAEAAARFSLALLTCVWQRARGAQGDVDRAMVDLERAVAESRPAASLESVLSRLLSHVDMPRLSERVACCLLCGKPHGAAPLEESTVDVVKVPATFGHLSTLLAMAMKQSLFESACPSCNSAAAGRKRVLRGGTPAWLLFHADEGGWVGGAPPDRFPVMVSIDGEQDTDVPANARLRAFVRREPGDRLAVWRRDADTPDTWWVTDGSGPARRRRDQELSNAPAAEMVFMYEVAPAGGAVHAATEARRHAIPTSDVSRGSVEGRTVPDVTLHPAPTTPAQSAVRGPSTPARVGVQDKRAQVRKRAGTSAAEAVVVGDEEEHEEEEELLPQHRAFEFTPRPRPSNATTSFCLAFLRLIEQYGHRMLPVLLMNLPVWNANSCWVDAILMLLVHAMIWGQRPGESGLLRLQCNHNDGRHGPRCEDGLALLEFVVAFAFGTMQEAADKRNKVMRLLGASQGTHYGAQGHGNICLTNVMGHLKDAYLRQGDWACKRPFPVDGVLQRPIGAGIAPDGMDFEDRIVQVCREYAGELWQPCRCLSPTCVPWRYFDMVPRVLVVVGFLTGVESRDYAGRGPPMRFGMAIRVGRECEEVRVTAELCGIVERQPQHFAYLRPMDLDQGRWEEVDPYGALTRHINTAYPRSGRVDLAELAHRTLACLYRVTPVP